METKLTFTFTFKVKDRSYTFNEVSKTREQALATLAEDLAKVIAEIKAGV